MLQYHHFPITKVRRNTKYLATNRTQDRPSAEAFAWHCREAQSKDEAIVLEEAQKQLGMMV